MSTDIVLNETTIELIANGADTEHVIIRSTDLELDGGSVRSNYSPSEEPSATPAGAPAGWTLRRALVHGGNDELVVNYGRDYRGGVRIHGRVVIDVLGKPMPSAWKPSSPSTNETTVELLEEIRRLRVQLAAIQSFLGTAYPNSPFAQASPPWP